MGHQQFGAQQFSPGKHGAAGLAGGNGITEACIGGTTGRPCAKAPSCGRPRTTPLLRLNRSCRSPAGGWHPV